MSWLDWLHLTIKLLAALWALMFMALLAVTAVVNYEAWRETHPKPVRNKTHGPTT